MFFRNVSPDEKARSWVFILYPETAPLNWANRLETLIVPTAISPLHSPERDEEHEGKPHFHILMSFSSPASAKKVVTMLYSVGLEIGIAGFRPSVPNYSMVQPASNQSSYIRYMCHLDQPDKEKLYWDDMRALNGLDINAVLSPSYSQELEFSNEIIDWCEEENICYFYDLVNYARIHKTDSWFVFLKQNSYFIKEYLRSKASKRDYTLKKEIEKLQKMLNDRESG